MCCIRLNYFFFLKIYFSFLLLLFRSEDLLFIFGNFLLTDDWKQVPKKNCFCFASGEWLRRRTNRQTTAPFFRFLGGLLLLFFLNIWKCLIYYAPEQQMMRHVVVGVLGLLYLPSSSFSFLGSLSHACGHPLRNIAVYRRRYTLVPPYLSLSLHDRSMLHGFALLHAPWIPAGVVSSTCRYNTVPVGVGLYRNFSRVQNEMNDRLELADLWFITVNSSLNSCP